MKHPVITSKLDIAKIILPALLAILLFIIAIFGFALPTLKDNLIEQKRKQITILTQTAWNILSYYENEIVSGNLTPESGRNLAKEQIKKLRYGPMGKDYFWINDLHPIMVMHPYLPDMVGKDVSNFVDHSGKYIFKEFLNEVRSKDESFIPYLWQWNDNPERISPKLSYIKLFKPWGWIIGTGVYLDDVHTELQMVSHRLIISSIIILVTVILLLALLVQRSSKESRKRLIAEEKVTQYQTNLEKLVTKRTNQLQSEKEKLQESEERFRSLSKASFEGIVIHQGGKILEANQLLAGMFGYSPEEVFQMETVEFIAPESRDLLVENIRSGYDLPYELSGLKKDGTVFPIEINAKTMPYKGISCRVASVRDITERKIIEAERENLIQKLQKTIAEVNVLRGILPICASCKKIRDDKGYWNQIEAYIQDHSDTLFSHGICPDCAKKLYPTLKL